MLDLLVVRIASWREAYRGMLPQPYLDEMRGHTRFPFPPGTWLAEVDRIVAAYLATDLPSPDAERERVEIRELYVHPNYWRTGLGRALVMRVAAHVAERGARELFLWVLEENRPAHAFYERVGFRRARGERRLVPTGGEKVPVLLYRLPLG